MKTLLDATYTTRNENPVIRLFYKTEEGRIVEEVDDFSPYFYALAEDEKKLEEKVNSMHGVVNTRWEELYDFGEKIKALRIEVQQPRDVSSLRSTVRNLESCKEVREADIPFAHRYIIDSGIVPMEHAEDIGLNIAAFDLEVYNPMGEPRPEKDPIIMISYADTHGTRKLWSTKGGDLNLDYVNQVSSEKQMIKEFIDEVKKQEIDLVVTYNGDNFDFPYLRERCDQFNLRLALGYDGSIVKMERRGMNRGSYILGRPHVDMYPVCRQVFNIARYRLEDIYLELFEEEKPDIKKTQMHEIWDSGGGEQFSDFFNYSMSDSDATLEIAKIMLPLQYVLSRIVRYPIYECSRAASGKRVEQLLIRRAHEENILVPNKPYNNVAKQRRKKSFSGGYVVEPAKGIQDDIVLLDFRSLYPSIIIAYNVDKSKLNCDCCSKDEKYESPTGHYFCQNEKGFIPSVLDDLITKRIEIKEKLSQDLDEEKKRMLDNEQQAIKLLANSMYGYFGFPRARWYSYECAESIAAWGRQYIHKTIEKAEENGFEVIYGDTDSIFITYPDELEKEDLLDRSKAFLKRINDELPRAMELEFEGFYPRGIFITKKRYALMDEAGVMTVKGLETRRRDWANIAKDTQDRVLNALLKDRDPEKAADIIEEVVEEVKAGEIPLKDLAINTRITKSIGNYIQPGPHVAAAKKAMKEGMEFEQGNIVTYIVTKGGDSISDGAQVIELTEEGNYDPDYYVNNQLIPAVSRIMEALDYTEDELKGLGRQTTLDSF